jgi:hypothetical protein
MKYDLDEHLGKVVTQRIIDECRTFSTIRTLAFFGRYSLILGMFDDENEPQWLSVDRETVARMVGTLFEFDVYTIKEVSELLTKKMNGEL